MSSIKAIEFSAQGVRLGDNFLLLGTDAYLIDQSIAKIKKALKGKGEFDDSSIYADDTPIAELIEHLDTYTIFSSAKLLTIKKVETLNKRSLEVIAEYLSSPSESQSLILVSEKSDAKFKAWKTILDTCQTLSCDPPKFASEIKQWLNLELKSIGKGMQANAIQEFISRIELDYYTAANELAKLDILSGERKMISLDDVITGFSATRVGTKIDFLRALGNKQAGVALTQMKLMLESEQEPIRVLYQFIQFYLTLWKIQHLRSRKISDNEISAKHLTDIYPTQRSEYLNFAKKHSLSALNEIIETLLLTDYQLKSSPIDRETILELAVIKILETK